MPETQASKAGFHFGNVSLDYWEGESVPALILDEKWNGYAQPYFEHETLGRIVERVLADGGDPVDEHHDLLSRTDEGVTRYTVPGWTWEEVTKA